MKWERCSNPEASTFEVSPDGASITFRPCGVTSYHPKDVEARYCAICHCFLEERQRNEVGRPTCSKSETE